MGDEWGPWIDHDGNGCHCKGCYVHVKRRDGSYDKYIAGTRSFRRDGSCRVGQYGCSSSWRFGFEYNGARKEKWKIDREIIRYRVRKPRGMAVLEDALNVSQEDMVGAFLDEVAGAIEEAGK